eukprot:1140322-Pelagomonas_calceolata.AAC.2
MRHPRGICEKAAEQSGACTDGCEECLASILFLVKYFLQLGLSGPFGGGHPQEVGCDRERLALIDLGTLVACPALQSAFSIMCSAESEVFQLYLCFEGVYPTG